jgi:ABC-type Fe3+-hydroxamate transport system substrate-binding protein
VRLLQCVGSAFLLLLVALTVGCANQQTATATSAESSKTAEKAVVAKAQQRWNALLKFDYAEAYKFISPVGRSKMKVQDYLGRVNMGHMRKAVVQSASCEAEICEVKVALDYVVPVKGDIPVSQVVSESWILDEGNWWFVYRG